MITIWGEIGDRRVRLCQVRWQTCWMLYSLAGEVSLAAPVILIGELAGDQLALEVELASAYQQLKDSGYTNIRIERKGQEDQ